jgi:hypothetical protein
MLTDMSPHRSNPEHKHSVNANMELRDIARLRAGTDIKGLAVTLAT